ncbi:lasso peptide biosynthesis B2 protein [Sediminibacterium sp.]|uniref:lasso peptide biosynthesis B2 protein n=1 Tax=Sediminibacterium sp. TaxID=1917865 RepID=UPI00273778F3|nr:lasso peptide biosynthesis B2 protein [Sediminibacterium sp.]MDP3566400.1 lasso peptide biosynthesis B2 protein [Sediminibacterium sp.]
MTIIHSFLKLNNETKWLLIKALTILWIVRIMLWIFSFVRIQRIIKRFTSKSGKNRIPLKRITWAIHVMSDFTPRPTCLVRALAGQILLSQYGYDSNIKIGVSRDKGEFEAHAWLEHSNDVVLGESEIDYVPIMDWNEKF